MFRTLELELKRIKASGIERRFPHSHSRVDGTIEIAGRKLVDFTNFDYLGLARNPKVVKAALQAVEEHGIFQPPSRPSSGSLAELTSAENRLAKFLGVEAAVFFSSRNQALLSLLSALLGQGELLAFDESTYAPVADAALLLEANPVPFCLDRIDSLADVIERSVLTPMVVYGEGIAPLSGEVFPLRYLQSKLGGESRVSLVLDESYSLVALGERGSGAFEASAAIIPGVAFVGGFGIGMPGYGGFVAGSSLVIEYIRQTSKAIESEPPLPAGIAAAIEAAIDLVELDLVARRKLAHSVKRLRSVFVEAGLFISGDDNSPIIGIRVPSFSVGRELVGRFLARGVLVELVGVRTLRKETPLIRIVVSSLHSDRQLDGLIDLVIESKAV